MIDPVPVVVLKVGGSLLEWPGLPDRLAEVLASRAGSRIVLMVGGGRAADLVRDLDCVHHLGPDRAHALALHALDLTAFALAALMDGLEVVTDPVDLDAAWRSGRVPVLAPRIVLADDDRHSPDPLPHSWEVTSDSIAARLADRLGAAELVLFKSAPLPPATDRAAAARLGLVDPAFPAAARALPRVSYLNLRDPSLTEHLIA